MGLGLFDISNCDRNVPILVKMRGQPTFDDLPLARYDIFLYISHSSILILKLVHTSKL